MQSHLEVKARYYCLMQVKLLLQDAAEIKVPPLDFMTCERVSW